MRRVLPFATGALGSDDPTFQKLGYNPSVVSQSLAIINPSFEADVISYDPEQPFLLLTNQTPITGWSGTFSRAETNYWWGLDRLVAAVSGFEALHGQNVAFLEIDTTPPNDYSTISQTLADVWLPSTTYTITFDVIQNDINIIGPGDPVGSYGLVSLLAGAAVVAETNVDAFPNVAAVGVLPFGFTFTTAASGAFVGQPVTIRFRPVYRASPLAWLLLVDNVQMSYVL